MIVLIGLIFLIALSAYLHRQGMTRKRWLVLLAAWLVLSLGTVTIYATNSASADAGVRCTRFVSRTFIGPLPFGTCRLASTTAGYTGWKGNWWSGYYKNVWVRVGNRDTERVANASSRGARDVVLAAGCGALATKFPVAGAVCAAVVTLDYFMLNDTFKHASGSGRCVYFEIQNFARPVNYRPVPC